MQGTRSAPIWGHLSIVLSVFALSTLALFPVLAQAEDSSGIQYSEATPDPCGGGCKSDKNEPPARSSAKKGGGDSGQTDTSTSGDDSQKKDSSSAVAAGNSKGDGGTGQGSPDKGSGGGQGDPVNEAGQSAPAASTTSQDNGGSSPLVPILIAIAVLTAISVAVMTIRARRQGAERDGSVSPEAS
jgi:cobalamin biosynthesis Mg chelatase CobN